jgi:putative phosphoribosyl transferase
MTQATCPKSYEQEVEIPCGSRRLIGILCVPAEANGAIIFAHGSGSGRLSPRNQFVARVLNQNGMATLLIDLLEEQEEEDREKVFDIPLLATRLQAAADWLTGHSDYGRLPMGYFGASTGAATALVAAARRPESVKAIVSRGGRPDLAADSLPCVRAPTLLIVGSRDEEVLHLNREAVAQLRCPRQLVVVPGATHLFPERGALEHVARSASEWFLGHLASRSF